MSATIKAVRATQQYKTYMKILEQARGKVELSDLQGEALAAHAGRLSRTLYGSKKYSPKYVLEATLKDLATRARLVEIRVRVSIALGPVQDAVKAARRFVLTEFADDLREFSTVDLRRAFVDRILKAGMTYQEEGEALIDLLDMFIKDIDQAGFAIRNVVEVLKLLDSRKGAHVV